MQYVKNACGHFNYIFGVHDHETGIFSFSKSKAEKREDAAALGMAAAFGMAFKAAKKGADSFTEEEKAKIEKHLQAVDDAATGGMSVYTRRADEAEAKIK